MKDLTHFLLVEDDDGHAKIIQRNLEKFRIANHLDRVKDGEDALNYLFRRNGYENKPSPDVILLDLKLPKLDGHEVLAQVRSNPETRDLIVVMLTTSDNERDKAQAYEHNVNSYVVKPVDFEQFQNLVRDTGLYWGIWNKSPIRGDEVE